ncbi:SDR family NAD(P)-dependent oxidoreductase [Candidatus Paracaedibacter symbiosus]|uniref:SDR family NAD(P)-dependent oxidoreductase n=1 Tax=Candidatus Paracaedibacter symbiosus TaxID=244582 RepID=UPI0006924035|nr:SDR family NAD(P)-dependent oxidoreductase [Candidatus Paracaedibacter symbiosus]
MRKYLQFAFILSLVKVSGIAAIAAEDSLEMNSAARKPVLAIAGVGPQLGFSIADKFGQEGFRVALISRNKDSLDEYVTKLGEKGVEAAAFPADLTKIDQVERAFTEIKDKFGQIDVLEFSPTPPLSLFRSIPMAQLKTDDLMEIMNTYTLPAIGVTNQVLSGMIEQGKGTIIYTTGDSPINPVFPELPHLGMAMTVLHDYAKRINAEKSGVHAMAFCIAGFIKANDEIMDPYKLANRLYEGYKKGTDQEIVIKGDLSPFEDLLAMGQTKNEGRE